MQTIVKVCEACQTMDDIESGLKKKITNVLLARLKVIMTECTVLIASSDCNLTQDFLFVG